MLQNERIILSLFFAIDGYDKPEYAVTLAVLLVFWSSFHACCLPTLSTV
jgi:hypothetical protein